MKEKQAIYRAVQSLTKRFGAGFTPAGVLVGALGEVLAEEKYDLDLLPPKTGAFDAIDCEGRKVQIRCNQQNTTPIKRGATKGMFLALKLLPDGSIKEIFNGPASVAHRMTDGSKADSEGLVGLSYNKLYNTMQCVPKSKRIPWRQRPQWQPCKLHSNTWKLKTRETSVRIASGSVVRNLRKSRAPKLWKIA